MTGDTHYDLEVLAELAEGLLDVATAARVREHLAICDPCGESLAELAAVREVLAAMPVPAMPMGVALRIDKALAAEAETRREGGLKLDEAPDWDRIMADSPWETPAPLPEMPVEPPAVERPEEVVPLGIVADDGSIVPARRTRRTSRRRSWAMPVAASVAAAVVIGGAGLTANMLMASGSGTGSAPPVALPQPTHSPAPSRSHEIRPGSAQADYPVAKSDYNYSSSVLDGPLATYVGATGPGTGSSATADAAVTRCVAKISARVGKKLGVKAPKPIGVDQGFYEGNEATVMAFWKDRFRNAVYVYVVDDNCTNVRPPAVSRWQ
ncbi:zf-HC2 domain-containing protein [Sphaerisporangium sp. NPDC051017]|uniref:zf-HC2 domain-containing protein n=1 Tax=Sphaerisporangium sp. NPDC051017 TaxID=3154636 RepID=UPI003417CB20